MAINKKGHKITVPDKFPNDLEKAMEMLGKVKYSSWGFGMIFLYKHEGKWQVSFRNAAKMQGKQPDTKSKTPLEACKKMHKFLLGLKKKGVRI